jgi:hypothetical protein
MYSRSNASRRRGVVAAMSGRIRRKDERIQTHTVLEIDRYGGEVAALQARHDRVPGLVICRGPARFIQLSPPPVREGMTTYEIGGKRALEAVRVQ